MLSGINTLASQDFAPKQRGSAAAHIPNYFALWNVQVCPLFPPSKDMTCNDACMTRDIVQMQLGSVGAPLLVGGLVARYSVAAASRAIGVVAAVSALWYALITPEMLKLPRGKKKAAVTI